MGGKNRKIDGKGKRRMRRGRRELRKSRLRGKYRRKIKGKEEEKSIG